MSMEKWLNEMVNGMVLDLRYHIEKRGRTKTEAVTEIMRTSSSGPAILKMALDVLDSKLAISYGDDAYYAICINQRRWYANRISRREFVEAGFAIRQNLDGDADYDVFIDHQLVAKLFKTRPAAVAYVHGSPDVLPLEVDLPATSEEQTPLGTDGTNYVVKN